MENLKVLLVDDSGTMQKMIKMALSKIGIEGVATALNGIEGMANLKESIPDLILCDWNMPEMNGYQFVTAVRADANFKHIPILMLTTVNTKDEVIEIMKAGANDFLNKPFTPDLLKDKIIKVTKG